MKKVYTNSAQAIDIVRWLIWLFMVIVVTIFVIMYFSKQKNIVTNNNY